MQLSILHLDDALEQQPDFLRACEQFNARHIKVKEKGADIRLWGKQAWLDALRDQVLPALKHTAGEPQLVFMGSGDFHHVTSLLISSALAHHPEPVTVIHFDNHPDWVQFEGGTHCGSWVNRALEQPFVQKVITLGVCSHDLRNPEWKGANLTILTEGKLELYPYRHAPSRVRKEYGNNPCFEQKSGALHWKTIEAVGEQAFIPYILSRIETEAIYITIDKDVLAREDAITNWDQGAMRLPYLIDLLKAITAKHRVIGADVTGDYSAPHYTGSLWTKAAKRGEILLDQPHCRPCSKESVHINMAANHSLLEVLSEAMA